MKTLKYTFPIKHAYFTERKNERKTQKAETKINVAVH